MNFELKVHFSPLLGNTLYDLRIDDIYCFIGFIYLRAWWPFNNMCSPLSLGSWNNAKMRIVSSFTIFDFRIYIDILQGLFAVRIFSCFMYIYLIKCLFTVCIVNSSQEQNERWNTSEYNITFILHLVHIVDMDNNIVYIILAV